MNKKGIEKAIEALRDFNRCVKVKADGAYETTDFINAKETAISALEQQLTMQERIDKAHDAGYYAGMEYARMKDTQQLNNGWIPVSERLPNIGETVLLTVAVNRGISHEYGSVDIAWICDKENKCFYGTDGKYSYDEAIAWQPLPEPYKEDKDAERN